MMILTVVTDTRPAHARMPGNCENHLVITGDTAAISQIHVHDIENILLVPIDEVNRTQPFKLTVYFKTLGGLLR